MTTDSLVFTGTPEGKFLAFDDETGEILWSFQTGSGIVGQPITWEQNGEQYVSVISGWGDAVPLWGGEVAKKSTSSIRVVCCGPSASHVRWPQTKRPYSTTKKSPELFLWRFFYGNIEINFSTSP